MIYAYVRVSTEEQNLDRQLEALKEYEEQNKITIDEIFEEKRSGSSFTARTIWQELNQKMQPGDILIVKEIDRLGRNYDEIKETWNDLRNNRNIKIIVLDMPLISTDIEKIDNLDNKLISNIVLELLCYLAQKEREKLSKRTKEGLKARKDAGVVLGRPSNKLPQEEMEELKIDLHSDMLLKDIVEKYGFANGKSLSRFIARNNDFLEYEGRRG